MKLLLDQGLPRAAAEFLRRAGLDVEHTGDVGMATAADDAILEYARLHGRVVVTLDADFHALLALSGAPDPSVIRLRVEGLRGPETAALIQSVLSACGEELVAGAMVSTDGLTVRARRLPLGQ